MLGEQLLQLIPKPRPSQAVQIEDDGRVVELQDGDERLQDVVRTAVFIRFVRPFRRVQVVRRRVGSDGRKAAD